MASQFSTTLRTNRVGQIGTTLGSGGTCEVRTGAGPGVGNADTGTVLCTFTAVTYATAASGQQSITATADTNCAASGTPGHARFKTSGGTAHMEVDAGVGSGTLNFNSAISAGGTATWTSGVFTDGNA